MTTAADDQGVAASTVGLANLRNKKKGAPAALDQLDAADLKMTRARASTARPDSYCLHCGRRISPGRHGRRKFCSNSCRTGAYKRRRRVEAAAVEGLASSEQ